MTLEHVFAQIAAKHDLHAVSFSLNKLCGADYQFSVSLHWEGYSRDGNPCQHGHGATLADALRNGLEAVAKDRDQGTTVDFAELLKAAA